MHTFPLLHQNWRICIFYNNKYKKNIIIKKKNVFHYHRQFNSGFNLLLEMEIKNCVLLRITSTFQMKSIESYASDLISSFKIDAGIIVYSQNNDVKLCVYAAGNFAMLEGKRTV